MVGDSAVIDLACFHPGFFLKDSVFEAAEIRLTTELSNNFSTRLTLPDIKHRVP
jgi:hypothetical protein